MFSDVSIVLSLELLSVFFASEICVLYQLEFVEFGVVSLLQI